MSRHSAFEDRSEAVIVAKPQESDDDALAVATYAYPSLLSSLLNHSRTQAIAIRYQRARLLVREDFLPAPDFDFPVPALA